MHKIYIQLISELLYRKLSPISVNKILDRLVDLYFEEVNHYIFYENVSKIIKKINNEIPHLIFKEKISDNRYEIYKIEMQKLYIVKDNIAFKCKLIAEMNTNWPYMGCKCCLYQDYGETIAKEIIEEHKFRFSLAKIYEIFKEKKMIDYDDIIGKQLSTEEYDKFMHKN